MKKKTLMEDPYATDLVRMMGLAGIPAVNKHVTERQMDEQLIDSESDIPGAKHPIEEAPSPKYWQLDKKQQEIQKHIQQLRSRIKMYGKMVAEEQQYGTESRLNREFNHYGDDNGELADHQYFLETLHDLLKGFDGEMI